MPPTSSQGMLLVLLLLYMVGLTLFSQGFLLTRLELDAVNSCSSLDHLVDLPKHSCWHPKRYNKTILVIIDALRFDFTQYQPDWTQNVPHYINKLPIFHQILTQNSTLGHGLLYRARADPPTTTLQRLKAITTGNLPTFVDAGSNFASTKIHEDNLIQQFIRHGKRVVFMGDDTWMGLFPDSLNESYPYPSFDVWDLHTVDNGVIKHLFPALQTPWTWDLLVAHFLGVDHAGHRYGPEHPAMKEKLLQMNGILERIFQQVDENTIVYVMGDHGMDPKGDHGGDSENELNAGLFVFSKKPLFEPDSSWNQVLGTLKKTNFDTEEPLVFLDNQRTFPQIDIVPTLAILSGLPVPFGNLGTIIPELFYVGQSPLENLISVARLNAHQIHTYITQYSQKRSWAADSLSLLENEFKVAETRFLVEEKHTVEDYIRFTKYSRSALISARKIWARFDVSLILMGCIVLLLTIFCLLLSSGLGLLVPWSYSIVLFGALGALLGYFEPVQYLLQHFSNQDAAIHIWHETLFFSILFMQLRYLSLSLYSILYRMRKTGLSLSKTFWSLNYFVAFLLLGLYMVGPASDSFTIYEDSITLYLLQTFGLFSLIMSQTVKQVQWRDELFFKSLFFMILTRISGYSTICREEQHPYCTPTFNYLPNSSIASPQAVILLGMLMIGVCFMIFKFHLKNGNVFWSCLWIIALGLILVFAYWTLDTVEGHAPEGSYPWIHSSKLQIARLGFPIWSLLSCFCFRNNRNSPWNPGWTCFKFSNVLLVHLLMVQKPMGGSMLLLGYLQLGLLLEMMYLWREKVVCMDWTRKKSIPKDMTGLCFLYASVLFLLSQRYFFATGHQRALSSIQYEVGFIGLEKVNWILSPLIILFNTFGSHALFLSCFPLLVFWRRSFRFKSSKTDAYLQVKNMLVQLIGIQVSCITTATLFAGHFRRHLMVWRVFAPKFIFGSVEMLVGFVVLWIVSCVVQSLF